MFSFRFVRYLRYSSSQNAKEKVNEVTEVQKSFTKHDFEIDVVEEILPLQRVSQLYYYRISSFFWSLTLA